MIIPPFPTLNTASKTTSLNPTYVTCQEADQRAFILLQSSLSMERMQTLRDSLHHLRIHHFHMDLSCPKQTTTTLTIIKQQLHHKFNIKDLGPLHYYLGIKILKNSHGLVMSQTKYALELLKCRDVLNDKLVTTPIDPIISLNLTEGEPLQDPFFCRTLVGKLIYLTIARHDISFVA